MYNLEIEKKQRRKLIAITLCMVAVIVVLIVAIALVVAGKSSNKPAISDAEAGEFSLVDDSAKTEEKKTETEAKTETKAEASTIGKISTQTKPEAAPTEIATSVPSTGPEDLLPVALLLGALTTGVSALALNKRKI